MIVKFLSTEPFLWGVGLGLSRIFQKGKSRALALLFRAPGLYLGPGSVVRGAKRIVFGHGVYANRNLWVEAVSEYATERFKPLIEIGDGVAFSDGVHITCIDHVVIERNVLMGSRVYISDHNHGCYKGPIQSGPEEPPTMRHLGGGGPVIIRENVWIGDNVVIVGPITIGKGSVVGANSVVHHDVPAETIVAGNPARPIKRFNVKTRIWEKL